MPTYGLLYTFDGAKALLPEGWRIPTLHDFEQLLDELGADYDGGAGAVRNLLKISAYSGTSISGSTVDRYFSLLLDEQSTHVDYDYLTIRFFAQDLASDGYYQRNIYRYNVSRTVASSVRFVKDAN